VGSRRPDAAPASAVVAAPDAVEAAVPDAAAVVAALLRPAPGEAAEAAGVLA
jgi:hypothetical protein